MQENFHLLQLVEQNDIIISDNTVLLQSLYPKYNPFLSVDYDIENLIIHSLFETSFSFKNHYFSHLRLSCLYIQEFLEVFIFLQQNVQLSLLKKAKLFKPLFIDKFYNTTEFGKSDRFLLIQENISLVQRELEYLKDYYKYAKLIVLAHQHANIQHLTNFNIIQVATSSDIFSHLKQNRFNAAYIIGFNTSDIETFFNSYDNTQALL
jgi:ferrochelatase